MANLPGSFSTPRASYTLLSDLSLLSNYHGMWEKFIEKYPQVASYNYLLQLGSQGAFKRINSDTRKYNHWEAKGKHLPRIAAAAGATGGGAGQAVTITLSTNSHEQSGTYSPVAPGMTYVNYRSGQYYQVTATNKTVAGAHTATIKPYKTTDTIVITTSDDLLFYGYVHQEEGSVKKDPLLKMDERITGEAVIIRNDERYTDLNIMEKIEHPDEYYKIRQERDIVSDIWGVAELQCMFGIAPNNLDTTYGMNATNSLGVIPQVVARGQVLNTATAVNSAFWDDLNRRIDAEGYSREFDYLLDTELEMKIDNYLATTYNNGAVLDAGEGASKGKMSVARNYKSYSIHNNKFNFTKYAYFNGQQVWGAVASTGQYSNYGLLIPQGEFFDSVEQQMMPRLAIRYQSMGNGVGGDNLFKKWETGALAPTPTSDEAVLGVHHIGYFGSQVFAANGYLITDLNV